LASRGRECDEKEQEMSNAERDSAGLTGMGGTPLAGRVALVPRSASPPAGPKVLRS
jgi:hypothetical protein